MSEPSKPEDNEVNLDSGNAGNHKTRRDFLRSLGRWSAIIIGGGAAWVNKAGGGGGAAWVNRAGGGGGGWVNAWGGGGGAAWVNRR